MNTGRGPSPFKFKRFKRRSKGRDQHCRSGKLRGGVSRSARSVDRQGILTALAGTRAAGERAAMADTIVVVAVACVDYKWHMMRDQTFSNLDRS